MNSADHTISAYTLDSATGALSIVSGSPFDAAGASAGMTADPSGMHLYAAGPAFNSIVAFTIGADGSLTQVAGSPFPAAGPVLLTIVQIPSQGA